MIEKRSFLEFLSSSPPAMSLIRIMNSVDNDENDRESRHVLESLLSNLPGIAYRCRNDPDNTMEYVSAGCIELTGYTPEDLIDSKRVSYSTLIHPLDREAVKNQVLAALREGINFDVYYRIRTSVAGEKWVRDRGRGVFQLNGEVEALEG